MSDSALLNSGRACLLICGAVMVLTLSACASGATLPATQVGHDRATLNAALYPDGDPGRWRFEYRRASSPTWSVTTWRSLAAGQSGSVEVEEVVGGLSPQTAYEARICGEETAGASPLAYTCSATVVDFATPAASSRFVTTSGDDGGQCTSAAPCRTLGRAYAVAEAGQVVHVAPGVYPAQALPQGTKPVTFRGRAGTVLRELSNEAANVTFDGLDIDAAFQKRNAFYNNGSDTTFKNGRVGNVTDEKGLLSASGCVNCVYDNVDFHDVRLQTQGVHLECVYSMSPGITIRNSRFNRCAIFDILFTRGDWWGQPLYGGFKLLDNQFGQTCGSGTNCGPGTGAYYSVMFHRVLQGIRNAEIRGNRFDFPVAPEGNTATNSVESCNTPPTRLPGIVVQPC
jgi:hypothetical protein